MSLYDRLVPAEALRWRDLTQTHEWTHRDDWGWIICDRETALAALANPRFSTPWLPWRKRQ